MNGNNTLPESINLDLTDFDLTDFDEDMIEQLNMASQTVDDNSSISDEIRQYREYGVVKYAECKFKYFIF